MIFITELPNTLLSILGLQFKFIKIYRSKGLLAHLLKRKHYQAAKYLDYIEQNLYNGFLAQQNRFTGMPTYFLPMKSGGVKTWGSPKNDFWCCHGTMVQAQTIYQNLCYYQKDGENRIYVAQYIPSEGEIYFGEGKDN